MPKVLTKQGPAELNRASIATEKTGRGLILSAAEPVREHAEGVTIEIYVQPGARKTEWAGRHGNRLKLKVQAPPVEGAANAAAIEFLAKLLAVSKGQIELIRGGKSRQKVLLVRGIDQRRAQSRIC